MLFCTKKENNTGKKKKRGGLERWEKLKHVMYLNVRSRNLDRSRNFMR